MFWFGAAAIAGAGSLIGGLFSPSGSHYAARKQLQAVRETNQMNYQIAQDNNAFNERMWNLQNEYNTPSAQRAYRDWETYRKSTRLNSSHSAKSRMPSSA